MRCENAGDADDLLPGGLKAPAAFDAENPGHGHEIHRVAIEGGRRWIMCAKH